MPELAEVEHSRRQWDPGLEQTILEVLIARPEIRVFRDTDTVTLRKILSGQRLLDSQARGKQMLFHFSDDIWLGIHLGMSGELRCEESPETEPRKHDHLILRQTGRALVFEDKRHFGRVRLHHGIEPPSWWNSLAPSILSKEFTYEGTAHFLHRRRRTPVKAVLLMQEHFPGVGNWMADEILWRASVHPSAPAGTLDEMQTRCIWEQVRWVSHTAIQIISDDWTYPSDWLFTHRWEAGGQCPRCHTALDRATVGGRTTCWCPQCQPPPQTAEVSKTKIQDSKKKQTPKKRAPAPADKKTRLPAAKRRHP